MMDFLSILTAAPEHTNLIAKFIDILNSSMGVGVGVTVIVFTIILKLALSPLDIWQKFAARKQTRKSAELQPQMEKLEKQYGNKPDILKQKQAELTRGQMTGMLGTCLPMIVTMVIFFVVLSGFNAFISVENEKTVYEIANHYNQNIGKVEAGEMTMEELDNELALLYETDGVEKFLWIKNIYMPDNWAPVIPTLDRYVGSGMGALNAVRPDNVNIENWYDTLIEPAANKLNKKSTFDMKNWNGYLVLPILSIVTSILSSLFMQASNPVTYGTSEQQKKAKRTQKFMMFLMPMIFGIFSLFYSSAFALYVFISSLFSTILGLSFNLITKHIDKKKAQASA